MRRTTRRFTPTCARILDANTVDDLRQEVFIRAIHAFDRFDHSRSVRWWLLGIARNTVREHVRRARRLKEVAWTELCLELEETIEADNPYEDFLTHLPHCTTALGDSARSALSWHYMSAMKLDEIAHKLQRSVGAVKILLVRARQALKRCIQAKLKGTWHD